MFLTRELTLMLTSISDLVVGPTVKIWELYLRLLYKPLDYFYDSSLVEEQRRTLTSLPIEVLFQITTLLDCPSVLAVRQVRVISPRPCT